MSERRPTFLDLADDAQARLIAAARDSAPVRGLTHDYYKYPARFSPSFATTAIQTFTERGDLVLDPHVGGGTTLVEALANGREAIGVDISTLAEFVAKVKCTVYSDGELEVLDWWAEYAPGLIDMRLPSEPIVEYQEQGYYKHLDHPSRWRLRKAIEQALAAAIDLGTPRLESFGRCVVLRTAQWALDGRSRQATVDEFRNTFRRTAVEMIAGARELRSATKSNGRFPITVLRRSAAGLETDTEMRGFRVPRLVITSPPYPGVHVLYHRWQVDGRKEAPLPFMIANKLDGAGLSYYTMGDRKRAGLAPYFENITATMSSVAALADEETIVVQMVAFSAPDWQLPKYLDAMKTAGLSELLLPALKGERLWRSVPGRRWYSAQRGTTPGSKEVVLIHRKAAR